VTGEFIDHKTSMIAPGGAHGLRADEGARAAAWMDAAAHRCGEWSSGGGAGAAEGSGGHHRKGQCE